MNDFYCAIFQTLLNAFEWDGNCSALCHSQNKQNIFPKPGCVFLSNWQQNSALKQEFGLTIFSPCSTKY